MVRTDSRITDAHTHPQTTARVSVETYRPRGETIGFKKGKRKKEMKYLVQGAMAEKKKNWMTN